jgi:hypothetical protein
MSDQDPKLEYKITTTADTTGADKAVKSVESLDKAAKETAKSTGDAGKALNQAGELSEKLSGGSRVVGEVLRGNLKALGQFPAVLKSIAAATVANPLFALGTIAGTLILPALQKIVDGWKAAGEAAKEAGRKSSEAADAARKAITEKQNNELAAEFKAIAAEAERAKQKIDEVAAAQIALVDANEAVALARIEANKGLTEVQRLEQRAATRNDFANRRLSIETDAIAAKQSEARGALRRTQEQLPEADRNAEVAARRLNDILVRSPAAIQAELDHLKAERVAITRGGIPTREATARVDEIKQRESDAELELVRATESHAAELKAAQELLAATNKKREELLAEEAEMRKRINQQEESDALKLQVLRAKRASTLEVEAIQKPDQLKAAQAADKQAAAQRAERTKRRGEIELEAQDAARRGDYGAVEKLGAERAKLDKDQAALDGVASAVKAQPAPQPLDVAPLQAAFIEYDGKMRTYVGGVQTQVTDLAKQVKALGQRLDNQKQGGSK